MRVTCFTPYAFIGESKQYKVISSIKWLQDIAKKAGVEIEIIDGRENTVVDNNIVFTIFGIKSWVKESQKEALDKFLSENKNNSKYLFIDDPIHVDGVSWILAGLFDNWPDKDGVGFKPSTIKMLKKGLLDGSIKVIIPSMFFKKGLSEGHNKYQDVLSKIDIQHINVGYFQYKALPNFHVESNNTAIVASMHDYNRKKVHIFCDKVNAKCVEFSRYTQKVDQLTAQMEIAKAKYLIIIPLKTVLSGTGWFRSAYLACYKYNTLCVCMDKHDAKLYNTASIDDVISDESIYNEMLNKQQKSLKKIIMDYKSTVDFIKNTFI